MAKRNEVLPSVDESVGEAVSDEKVDLAGGGAVTTSLKFTWTQDEKETIDTIKSIVQTQVSNEFAPAYVMIRKLLDRVRVIEGVDETGSPVYKKNPDGSYMEDWSSVDAVDMDATILNAAVYAFFAGQLSIDSYAEAVFSKFMSEDAYNDAFHGIMSGTVEDKKTTALRKSREERYFAFYRAYLYKKIKEVVDRLDSMRRAVEFVRQMQSKDRDRERYASGN